MTELMSEKNFDSITIKDISDRADVSRRTIYLHYEDKYDLLDKLIEEHIHELRESCSTESEVNSANRKLTWFEYFEQNYLFFSAMLSSKGAPFFRSRFLEFVIEDIKNEWEMTEGKKQGLYEDIILQFIAPAYVGIVEWWFTNEMPYPPDIMENQLEILLENNLS